jgi:hypothetical protein
MSIAGRCHCGNITFTLRWPEEPAEIPARACDCSFCVKHGGVWTSHPDAALEVTVRDPALVSRYRFGTGTADFHVCARCGAVPLVTCEVGDRLRAVVNVNVLAGEERARLRPAPASFAGEEVADRLARRQRNWIGTVRIDGA